MSSSSTKIKRSILVVALSIAFLVAFGALTYSPPSIVDTITGATPRATKEEQAKAKLEGNYIFGVNKNMEKLSNQDTVDALKEFVSGQSNTLAIRDANDLTLTIYVSETDYALVRYARKLCVHLENSGVKAKIKRYRSELLYSKVVSGKYEAFLAYELLVDVKKVENIDYIMLNSTEMG